jgi:hypothetical protein
MAARVAVTPLGLGRAASARLLYEHGSDDSFGQGLAQRCPHDLEDEGGACGVWAHRNAVCATWFCKHDRGATGEAFWRALQRLLQLLERAISRFCLLEIGLDTDALAALLPPAEGTRTALDATELDGVVAEARYRELWGAGAAARASSTSPAASASRRSTGTPPSRSRAWRARCSRGSRARRSALDAGPPERLVPGELTVCELGADHASVQTYRVRPGARAAAPAHRAPPLRRAADG